MKTAKVTQLHAAVSADGVEVTLWSGDEKRTQTFRTWGAVITALALATRLDEPEKGKKQ